MIGINTHVGSGYNESRGLLMTEALKKDILGLADKLLKQHEKNTWREIKIDIYHQFYIIHDLTQDLINPIGIQSS